jgi:hypothetical protein
MNYYNPGSLVDHCFDAQVVEFFLSERPEIEQRLRDLPRDGGRVRSLLLSAQSRGFGFWLAVYDKRSERFTELRLGRSGYRILLGE